MMVSIYGPAPVMDDWRLKAHQDQTFEYLKLKIAAEWQHPNRGTQEERMYKLLKEIAVSICRPEQRAELVKLADLEDENEDDDK
jgi:hypothetical protein